MKKDHTFKASDGEIIRATLFGDENLGKGKVIIFVHGFKGFKDWGFWPYMGEYFASKGFVALSFNFSHNGVGESLTEFDELDKFAKNTYSREVRELSEVIDAVKAGHFGDIGGKDIVLLGHSRGGGISLATAKIKPEISKVVLWASVATFDRHSEDYKNKWRKAGFFEVVNQRTKQVMRLDATLLEDLYKNADGLLNLKDAVKKLDRPLLIAHGEQDISVPPGEAAQLYDWSNQKLTELFKLPSTGHTFGIVHPFEGTCEVFDRLLLKTAEWAG